MIKKHEPYQISGYSLIEMLIVVSIFVVLAILATQSLMLTFRASRKSEAMINTQRELRYALAVIERGLYNADSIESNCDGLWMSSIQYVDEYYFSTSFSCETDLTNGRGYMASNSAQLTSTQKINITTCQFKCIAITEDEPTRVDINLTAVDVNTSGAEGSEMSVSNSILLRSY
jgi:prepilin-type N-terminal cleavage/methylation domain-containing protein